jgi:hypothetical protein
LKQDEGALATGWFERVLAGARRNGSAEGLNKVASTNE